MPADFVLKGHDTRPTLRVTLKEGDPAAPTAVDLTSATSVKLLMKPIPSGTVISRSGAFVSPRTGGQVDFTFQAADTATAGDYNGEVEVTWSDGGIETFPNSTYLAITIMADLG
jgi:hypothetical protein